MFNRRTAMGSLTGLAAAMLPAGLVTKAQAAETSRPPAAVVDPGAPWTTAEWVEIIQQGIDKRAIPATVTRVNDAITVKIPGGGLGYIYVARDTREQSRMVVMVPGAISDDTMIPLVTGMLSAMKAAT